MPTYKTEGLDLKVPIQAIVTVAVAVAAYFGVELDAEVSAAIAILLGAVAGYFGPAPKTVPKANGPAVVEPGGGAGV